MEYTSPIASAQVKSAVLLAGLHALGQTRVTEPVQSRDHTERMLAAAGVPVVVDGPSVSIEPVSTLNPIDIDVPGDPSSAAFWITLAATTPGSEVRVADSCLNPTRTGLIDQLRHMGASIQIENRRQSAGEPVGDIIVRHQPLKGIDIGAHSLPRMIDEVPILALAAMRASGVTRIYGATELRVKESG
jgi:3-phosphoshikimate 1-carboxyvinyltransferase